VARVPEEVDGSIPGEALAEGTERRLRLLPEGSDVEGEDLVEAAIAECPPGRVVASSSSPSPCSLCCGPGGLALTAVRGGRSNETAPDASPAGTAGALEGPFRGNRLRLSAPVDLKPPPRGTRVGEVGAICAGANGTVEMLAELGMMLTDAADRLADRAGHSNSRTLGC
jgi:hypothetical protein